MEGNAAEGNGVAVVEDAADLDDLVAPVGLGAVAEVFEAAAFDDGNVAIHDFELCAGFFDNFGAPSGVIDVGVADEEDLDVFPVEAELLDVFANLGDGGVEIGVDEDEAFGCGDEIHGEVFSADVVEVVGDAEGFVLLRQRGFAETGGLLGSWAVARAVVKISAKDARRCGGSWIDSDWDTEL